MLIMHIGVKGRVLRVLPLIALLPLALLFPKLTYLGGVREKSSHYGLNMLGYTCATKAKTERRNGEIQSKALKIVSVRIVNWNSFT